MVRDTQEGKARFDLLFAEHVPYKFQFLTRVAELLERGARKYGSRNWERAESEEEMERFKASAMRHLAQWVSGETDEDHAAAVVANLLFAETTEFKRGRAAATRVLTGEESCPSPHDVDCQCFSCDWIRDHLLN